MAAPPHWAIATHKGGTGKSKLIELIAAAAAEKGDNVLVVDMDAQANVTRRLRAQLPEDPRERKGASLAAILQRPSKGRWSASWSSRGGAGSTPSGSPSPRRIWTWSCWR
ncbi:nucleotide-binding protein [Actinomadura keratinilytica]|uniref:nucleotide-binding protein n=1 Tax=Actinomadura keratinilytica TaxID=547461 RepID=UPI003610AE09